MVNEQQQENQNEFQKMLQEVRNYTERNAHTYALRSIAKYYKFYEIVRKLDAIDIIYSVDGKLNRRLIEERASWKYNMMNRILCRPGMKAREEYDAIMEVL
jgi:hypothetical protein